MTVTHAALITDRRSGSTMLAKTLNLHSHIHCSGEIFNSYAAVDGQRYSETGYAATVERFRAWRRSPHPPTTVSVVTLIHRWQAELFPGLWELTRGLHSRFICLYRDNLLRHFLSEMVAMQTGKWTSDPKTISNLPRLTVDPDALETFVRTRYRERANDWNFQPRIEYSLERLIQDWDAQIHRIQCFLGLPEIKAWKLEPALPKQETRPLKTIVTNYDEVQEAVTRLGHPEWAED